jgi:hypothetical protein
MHFDGRHEVVATLLFATEDLDGSQHLIYDQVERSTNPRDFPVEKDCAFHAEGEFLLSIEVAG